VEEGIDGPDDIDRNTEASIFNSNSVKHWVAHELFLVMFLVVESIPHNWQRSHRDVVELVNEGVIKCLS
jgi:hypothetical protein